MPEVSGSAVIDKVVALPNRKEQEEYVEKLDKDQITALLKEMKTRIDDKKQVPEVFRESWMLLAIDRRLAALEEKLGVKLAAKQEFMELRLKILVEQRDALMQNGRKRTGTTGKSVLEAAAPEKGKQPAATDDADTVKKRGATLTDKLRKAKVEKRDGRETVDADITVVDIYRRDGQRAEILEIAGQLPRLEGNAKRTAQAHLVFLRSSVESGSAMGRTASAYADLNDHYAAVRKRMEKSGVPMPLDTSLETNALAHYAQYQRVADARVVCTVKARQAYDALVANNDEDKTKDLRKAYVDLLDEARRLDTELQVVIECKDADVEGNNFDGTLPVYLLLEAMYEEEYKHILGGWKLLLGAVERYNLAVKEKRPPAEADKKVYDNQDEAKRDLRARGKENAVSLAVMQAGLGRFHIARLNLGRFAEVPNAEAVQPKPWDKMALDGDALKALEERTDALERGLEEMSRDSIVRLREHVTLVERAIDRKPREGEDVTETLAARIAYLRTGFVPGGKIVITSTQRRIQNQLKDALDWPRKPDGTFVAESDLTAGDKKRIDEKCKTVEQHIDDFRKTGATKDLRESLDCGEFLIGRKEWKRAALEDASDIDLDEPPPGRISLAFLKQVQDKCKDPRQLYLLTAQQLSSDFERYAQELKELYRKIEQATGMHFDVAIIEEEVEVARKEIGDFIDNVIKWGLVIYFARKPIAGVLGKSFRFVRWSGGKVARFAGIGTPEKYGKLLQTAGHTDPLRMAEALKLNDFTSADDLAKALHAAGVESTDDIARALKAAGCDKVDDVASAMKTFSKLRAKDFDAAMRAIKGSDPAAVARAMKYGYGTDDVAKALYRVGYGTADEIGAAMKAAKFEGADDVATMLGREVQAGRLPAAAAAKAPVQPSGRAVNAKSAVNLFNATKDGAKLQKAVLDAEEMLAKLKMAKVPNVQALRLAERQLDIARLQYAEGLLGKPGQFLTVGPKGVLQVTEEGAQLLEVTRLRGINDIGTLRAKIKALQDLGYGADDIHKILRSGAGGEAAIAVLKANPQLAKYAGLLDDAVKAGNMTRQEAAVLKALLSRGKLPGKYAKLLEEAADGGKALGAKEAKLLGKAVRGSKFAKILGAVGKGAVVAAAVYNTYLLAEGIERGIEWGQEHDKMKKKIHSDLRNAGFTTDDGGKTYKHKNGMTVKVHKLEEAMDAQQQSAFAESAIAGGSLVMLGAGFFIGGPWGLALAAVGIVVELTIGKVVEGWSNAKRMEFLVDCPSWLLVAIGTYSTIHKSPEQMLDYLSEWRVGERLYAAFTDETVEGIEGRKPEARKKLLFLMLHQELGSYAPEMLADILVPQKRQDKGGAERIENRFEAIERVYGGEFDTLILPYFYIRLRAYMGDDAHNKSDEELFGECKPKQIREALRDAAVFYVGAKREERYLEMKARLDEKPDAVVEIGGQIIPIAKVVELMGEQDSFGVMLKDVDEKELRAFLAKNGVKSRAEYILKQCENRGKSDLGNVSIPGYRGKISVSTFYDDLDPVTRKKLWDVYEEVDGQDGFKSTSINVAYAATSLYLNFGAGEKGLPVRGPVRNPGLADLLVKFPKECESVGRQRLGYNTSLYFRGRTNVSRNEEWEKAAFGGGPGCPTVYSTGLYLAWYQRKGVTAAQHKKEEEDRIYAVFKACVDSVKSDKFFGKMKMESVVFQQDLFRERKFLNRKSNGPHDYASAIGQYFTEENGVMQMTCIMHDGKNRYIVRRPVFAFRNYESTQGPQLTDWKFVYGDLQALHYNELAAEEGDLLQRIDGQERYRLTEDAIAKSDERAIKGGEVDEKLKFRRDERALRVEKDLYEGDEVSPLVYVSAPESMKFDDESIELQLCNELKSGGGSRFSGEPGAVFFEAEPSDDGKEIMVIATYVENSIRSEREADNAGFGPIIHRRAARARKNDNDKWEVLTGVAFNKTQVNGGGEHSMWLVDARSLGKKMGGVPEILRAIYNDTEKREKTAVDDAMAAIEYDRNIGPDDMNDDTFYALGSSTRRSVARTENGVMLFTPRERTPNLKRYQLYIHEPKSGRYYGLPLIYADIPTQGQLKDPKTKAILDEKMEEFAKRWKVDKSTLTLACISGSLVEEFDTLIIQKDDGKSMRVHLWTITELLGRRNLTFNERETILDALCMPAETAEASLDRILQCFREEVPLGKKSCREELKEKLIPLYEKAPDKKAFLRGLIQELLKFGWIAPKAIESIAKSETLVARSEKLHVPTSREHKVNLPKGYALSTGVVVDELHLSVLNPKTNRYGTVTIVEGANEVAPIEDEPHLVVTRYALDEVKKGQKSIVVKDEYGDELMKAPLAFLATLRNEKVRLLEEKNEHLINTGLREYAMYYDDADSLVIKEGYPPRGSSKTIKTPSGEYLDRYGPEYAITFRRNDVGIGFQQFENAGALRGYFPIDRFNEAVEAVQDADARKKLEKQVAVLVETQPKLHENDAAQKKAFDAIQEIRRMTEEELKDEKRETVVLLEELVKEASDELGFADRRSDILRALSAPTEFTNPKEYDFFRQVDRMINLFCMTVPSEARSWYVFHMKYMFQLLPADQRAAFLMDLFNAMEDESVDEKKNRINSLQEKVDAERKEASPNADVIHRLLDQITRERKIASLNTFYLKRAEETMQAKYPKEHAAYTQAVQFSKRAMGKTETYSIYVEPTLVLAEEKPLDPDQAEEPPEKKPGYFIRHNKDKRHYVLTRRRDTIDEPKVEPPPSGNVAVVGPRAVNVGMLKDETATQAPRWFALKDFRDVSLAEVQKRYGEQEIPADVKLQTDLAIDAITIPPPPGSSEEVYKASVLNILDLWSFDVAFRGADVAFHCKQRLLNGLMPLYMAAPNKRAFLQDLLKAMPVDGVVREREVAIMLSKFRVAERKEACVPSIDPGDTTEIPLDMRRLMIWPQQYNDAPALTIRLDKLVEEKGFERGTISLAGVLSVDALLLNKGSTDADREIVLDKPAALKRTDLMIVVRFPDKSINPLVIPLKFTGTEELRQERANDTLARQFKSDVSALKSAAAKATPSFADVQANLENVNAHLLDGVAFPKEKNFGTEYFTTLAVGNNLGTIEFLEESNELRLVQGPVPLRPAVGRTDGASIRIPAKDAVIGKDTIDLEDANVPGEKRTDYFVSHNRTNRSYLVTRGRPKQAPETIVPPKEEGDSGYIEAKGFRFGVVKDADPNAMPKWIVIKDYRDISLQYVRENFEASERAKDRKRLKGGDPFLAELNKNLPNFFIPLPLPDELRIQVELAIEAITTPPPPGSSKEAYRDSLLDILDLWTYFVQKEKGKDAPTNSKQELLNGLLPLYLKAADKKAFLKQLLAAMPTRGFVMPGTVESILRTMRVAERREEFVPAIVPDVPAAMALGEYTLHITPVDRRDGKSLTFEVKKESGAKENAVIEIDTFSPSLANVPSYSTDRTSVTMYVGDMKAFHNLVLIVKVPGRVPPELLRVPIKIAGTEAERLKWINTAVLGRLRMAADELKWAASAEKPNMADVQKKMGVVNAMLNDDVPFPEDRDFGTEHYAMLVLKGGAGVIVHEAGQLKLLKPEEMAKRIKRDADAVLEKIRYGNYRVDEVKNMVDKELNPLLVRIKNLDAEFFDKDVLLTPTGFARYALKCDKAKQTATIVQNPDKLPSSKEAKDIEAKLDTAVPALVAFITKGKPTLMEVEKQYVAINELITSMEPEHRKTYSLAEEFPELLKVPTFVHKGKNVGLIVKSDYLDVAEVDEEIKYCKESIEQQIKKLAGLADKKYVHERDLVDIASSINGTLGTLRELQGSAFAVPKEVEEIAGYGGRYVLSYDPLFRRTQVHYESTGTYSGYDRRLVYPKD